MTIFKGKDFICQSLGGQWISMQQCGKSTRTFPSAGKGSWGLLIIFKCAFWSNNRWFNDLSLQLFSFGETQLQGEPTQTHAMFLFLFCSIPLVFRVCMTMSSILAILVLYWLLALLRAQSFAVSKPGDWGHLFTSIYLITAHFHSNDPHSPICFQIVTCNLAPVSLWSCFLSIHNLCMLNEPLHTQFLSYN